MLVVAFICGMLMDITWAMCVSSVARRRAAIAAHLSVLIYACSYLSTVLIVDKHVSAIVAFAAGNWIGTYLTVKWMKK